jgi:hypothetical protein
MEYCISSRIVTRIGRHTGYIRCAKKLLTSMTRNFMELMEDVKVQPYNCREDRDAVYTLQLRIQHANCSNRK